jgi:hypothetical protein
VFPEVNPVLTFALDAALLAMAGAAPIALVYFIRGWYRVRPPRPSLFTMLVLSDVAGLVAGMYLAAVAYVRMNDRVVPEWALPEVSALCAIALLLPVVAHGLFLFRLSASPDLFMPGPKGDTGERGEKGDKGDSNGHGRPGIQGPIGPQGVAGPPGEDA